MTEFDKFVESTGETLQEAVAAALDKKRRLGQYAVIYRDGKIMHMIPEPPVLGEWKLEESSANVSDITN
jgi:hypothetical protein